MDIAKFIPQQILVKTQDWRRETSFFHLFPGLLVSPLVLLNSCGSPGSAFLRSLHKKEVLFMGYHNYALQGSLKLGTRGETILC